MDDDAQEQSNPKSVDFSSALGFVVMEAETVDWVAKLVSPSASLSVPASSFTTRISVGGGTIKSLRTIELSESSWSSLIE